MFNTARARQFIINHLQKNGASSSEDIVDAAIKKDIIPPDLRSWGGVFQGLSRDNVIHCLCADLPRRRGHNTSGGKLWALL